MTNKLPVVGKRYRYKGDLTNEAFRHFFTSNSSFKFHEWFEELPEDNQTTETVAKMKNIAQDGGQHNSDLRGWFKAHRDNVQLATDDSLEKPKESIWKPVSELPYDKWSIIKERGEVYLTRKESDIYDVFYDKQAIGATFTDFINQYNSLLDRVERLEKIINKDR